MIIAITVTLFFIIIRFTVTLFNFISNPKLTKVNRQYADLVSILIPARNEEDNILLLLKSILQQDYTNYEVIVYDDESSDNTYSICADFAARYPQFSVIKGGKLPAGWLGKNYACHQLANFARGKYLLFLDADEVINKGLINSGVHRMQAYKLALLSLFPNQVMKTIGEKTTVPLLHYILLNLVPLRLVYLTKSAALAIANGQFMLFDATVYRQKKWHEMVKDEIVEDAEIMKRVKQTGFKGELLLANGMISCRMYKSYAGALSGFSKNVLAVFNNNILALLLYIILILGGPMLVAITLNFNLIFFMLGLILLTRIMISLSAGQNAWMNIVFHPLQMVNMMIIAFLSIQKHLTNTNTWKGRSI
ncbi:glycosyltransferase [Mucilaginibacter sp. X4EP1]|uniref:glycosyltransferase n=1 Tax=Mucilaginibacter sp. X4EP1 TaxID=2723092 RepID=UPI00216894F6|nr:glycosyltransferase [Mucilaginibacter sp. X4EP1]MCS3811661.1 chlorobactene glucosyltransferase [Mucilaginibacter sp. X4EP1]